MERHLNLVETEYKECEKRILPRFPFTYLTFKDSGTDKSLVYEVKDISYSGMQLSLHDGALGYKKDDKVSGVLHWYGIDLKVDAKVKWLQGSRFGVSFNKEDKEFKKQIKSFLSLENIIQNMKSLHDVDIEMDLPANLKYWLRSDGPFEIFIWQHSDCELAKFQIVLMKNFVEWEDGKGIKTGKILTKRDVDLPLSNEDEFVFEIDEGADMEKIRSGLDVVDKIPEKHLPLDIIEFLQLKLGK